VSCVVWESNGVQLRPAVFVPVVPCNAGLSVSYCNFSKEQSILPEDDL